MEPQNNAVTLLGIIAIIAVLGLVIGGSMVKITGFAVDNSGKAKTDNTPCARGCTIECTPNANLPNPAAAELSVHDCVLQCMNARCGQNANAGKCDAFTADGCCNVFATADPDCVVGYCDWEGSLTCDARPVIGMPAEIQNCMDMTGQSIQTCCMDTGYAWCGP